MEKTTGRTTRSHVANRTLTSDFGEAHEAQLSQVCPDFGIIDINVIDSGAHNERPL